MKRHANIYDKELTLKNIHQAYNNIYRACKNKKEIHNFQLNKNANLWDIYILLKNKKYEFENFKIFIITDPKYRLIMSEYVKDKVVNHFVAQFYLSKYLDSSLIYANVATRKNKGTKVAAELFKKFVTKNSYILKIDIKKFFYNIDHEIALSLVEKKIKDKNVIDLLKNIMDSTDNPAINKTIKLIKKHEIGVVKNLKITNSEKEIKVESINNIPEYTPGRGLPIGNMTSQILAVYYLNELDHFIKEELKIKKYVRYMDDLVLIDEDKFRLQNILPKILDKLKDYKLEANDKTRIYCLKNGAEFLGYKYKYLGDKLIIKYNQQTLKRINRRLKQKKKISIDDYLQSIGSYWGYFKESNTKLKRKYEIVSKLTEKYYHYKKEFPESIIIIKEGNFYKSLDCEIVWYLFGYKIINDVIAFPNIEKVQDKLEEMNINYAIVIDTEVCAVPFVYNRYNEIHAVSVYKPQKEKNLAELVKILDKKLDRDLGVYSNVYNFLQGL